MPALSHLHPLLSNCSYKHGLRSQVAMLRVLRDARKLRARASALQVARRGHGRRHGALGAAGAARSASTQRDLSTYALTRVKMLQLIGRTLLAYPQLSQLESAESPLAKYFDARCSARERMFMFICSLVPPEEPVDIPRFLDGATQAVHAVYQQLYAPQLDAGGDQERDLLSHMATEEVVKQWSTKLEAQKKLLGLPADATLTLAGLNVRKAGLSEVEYSYSVAEPEQDVDTQSVFQLNEALRVKVRFSVTELLLAGDERDKRELDEEPDSNTTFWIDSSFEWSFDSNIARVSLVDWYIAEVTPFEMKMSTPAAIGQDSGVVTGAAESETTKDS